MGKIEDPLREFRWPRKGDRPFRRSPGWDQNARLQTNASSKMALMIYGYKRGADLMVERSKGSRFERNTLAYPVIFNYRHYIELELKYFISTYGPPVGIDPNWTSHDIAFLWSQFRKVLAGHGVDDPEGTDDQVASIVGEFAKIDPGSYSYRYPVDLRGNEVPLAYDELDLEVLADVMDGASMYFKGCDGYLHELWLAEP